MLQSSMLAPCPPASTWTAAPRRLAAWGLRSLAALLLVGSAACGAAAPVRCESMPVGCDPGTTCWPVDQAGNYQCLESKTYKPIGSDCALLVGHTTCADGMLCAPMKDKKDVLVYRCTNLCDANTPCGAGATCTAVTLFPTAPQLSVCILPPAP